MSAPSQEQDGGTTSSGGQNGNANCFATGGGRGSSRSLSPSLSLSGDYSSPSSPAESPSISRNGRHCQSDLNRLSLPPSRLPGQRVFRTIYGHRNVPASRSRSRSPSRYSRPRSPHERRRFPERRVRSRERHRRSRSRSRGYRRSRSRSRGYRRSRSRSRGRSRRPRSRSRDRRRSRSRDRSRRHRSISPPGRYYPSRHRSPRHFSPDNPRVTPDTGRSRTPRTSSPLAGPSNVEEFLQYVRYRGPHTRSSSPPPAAPAPSRSVHIAPGVVPFPFNSLPPPPIRPLPSIPITLPTLPPMNIPPPVPIPPPSLHAIPFTGEHAFNSNARPVIGVPPPATHLSPPPLLTGKNPAPAATSTSSAALPRVIPTFDDAISPKQASQRRSPPLEDDRSEQPVSPPRISLEEEEEAPILVVAEEEKEGEEEVQPALSAGIRLVPMSALGVNIKRVSPENICAEERESSVSRLIEITNVPKSTTVSALRSEAMCKYGIGSADSKMAVRASLDRRHFYLETQSIRHALHLMRRSEQSLLSAEEEVNCRTIPLNLANSVLQKYRVALRPDINLPPTGLPRSQHNKIIFPCLVTLDFFCQVDDPELPVRYHVTDFAYATHSIVHSVEGKLLSLATVSKFVSHFKHFAANNHPEGSLLLILETKKKMELFWSTVHELGALDDLRSAFQYVGVLPADFLQKNSAGNAPEMLDPSQILDRTCLLQDALDSSLDTTTLTDFFHQSCTAITQAISSNTIDSGKESTPVLPVCALELRLQCHGSDIAIVQLGLDDGKENTLYNAVPLALDDEDVMDKLGYRKDPITDDLLCDGEIVHLTERQVLESLITKLKESGPFNLIFSSTHLALSVLLPKLASYRLLGEFHKYVLGVADIKSVIERKEFFSCFNPISGLPCLEAFWARVKRSKTELQMLMKESPDKIAAAVKNTFDFIKPDHLYYEQLSQFTVSFDPWLVAALPKDYNGESVIEIKIESKRLIEAAPEECLIYINAANVEGRNIEKITKSKLLKKLMIKLDKVFADSFESKPMLALGLHPSSSKCVQDLSFLAQFGVETIESIFSLMTNLNVSRITSRVESSYVAALRVEHKLAAPELIGKLDIFIVTCVTRKDGTWSQICVFDPNTSEIIKLLTSTDGSNDSHRKHKDTGIILPLSTDKVLANEWEVFLNMGNRKIVVTNELCQNRRLFIREGKVHPKIAGFIDLEWCLPIRKRPAKKLSWVRIVELCIDARIFFIPQEADSIASLIGRALRFVLQGRITYPLCHDNFVSRFCLESRKIHLLKDDQSILFPIHSADRIANSTQGLKTVKLSKASPERKMATGISSSTSVAAENALERRQQSNSGALPCVEPSKVSNNVLIEVIVSLTVTAGSTGCKLLTHFEVFLPQRPAHRFELRHPVPLYKIPQIAFDQAQFKWGSEGNLLHLSNGCYQPCTLKVDFLKQFQTFLNPITSEFSGHLVMIFWTAPHFAIFNEAFHHEPVLEDVKKHFRGWVDVASTVHTCMDKSRYKVIKATSYSMSNTAEELYFNAFGKKPETRCSSSEIMSEVLDHTLGTPFGKLPGKLIEPFSINMNSYTCVIVHCDTIEIQTDLLYQKQVIAASFLIPALDKECILALIPDEQLHHLDLSSYGLSRNADATWSYFNRSTSQTITCIHAQEALQVLFSVVRSALEDLRSPGVVFVSASKDNGIPHIMKMVNKFKMEEEFFSLAKGFGDVVTYLRFKNVLKAGDPTIRDVETLFKKYFPNSQQSRSCSDVSTMCRELLNLYLPRRLKDLREISFTPNAPYVQHILYKSLIAEFREGIGELILEDDFTPMSDYTLATRCSVKNLIFPQTMLNVVLTSNHSSYLVMPTHGGGSGSSCSIMGRDPFHVLIKCNSNCSKIKKGSMIGFAMVKTAFAKICQETAANRERTRGNSTSKLQRYLSQRDSLTCGKAIEPCSTFPPKQRTVFQPAQSRKGTAKAAAATVGQTEGASTAATLAASCESMSSAVTQTKRTSTDYNKKTNAIKWKSNSTTQSMEIPTPFPARKVDPRIEKRNRSNAASIIQTTDRVGATILLSESLRQNSAPEIESEPSSRGKSLMVSGTNKGSATTSLDHERSDRAKNTAESAIKPSSSSSLLKTTSAEAPPTLQIDSDIEDMDTTAPAPSSSNPLSDKIIESNQQENSPPLEEDAKKPHDLKPFYILESYPDFEPLVVSFLDYHASQNLEISQDEINTANSMVNLLVACEVETMQQMLEHNEQIKKQNQGVSVESWKAHLNDELPGLMYAFDEESLQLVLKVITAHFTSPIEKKSSGNSEQRLPTDIEEKSTVEANDSVPPTDGISSESPVLVSDAPLSTIGISGSSSSEVANNDNPVLLTQTAAENIINKVPSEKNDTTQKLAADSLATEQSQSSVESTGTPQAPVTSSTTSSTSRSVTSSGGKSAPPEASVPLSPAPHVPEGCNLPQDGPATAAASPLVKPTRKPTAMVAPNNTASEENKEVEEETAAQGENSSSAQASVANSDCAEQKDDPCTFKGEASIRTVALSLPKPKIVLKRVSFPETNVPSLKRKAEEKITDESQRKKSMTDAYVTATKAAKSSAVPAAEETAVRRQRITPPPISETATNKSSSLTQQQTCEAHSVKSTVCFDYFKHGQCKLSRRECPSAHHIPITIDLKFCKNALKDTCAKSKEKGSCPFGPHLTLQELDVSYKEALKESVKNCKNCGCDGGEIDGKKKQTVSQDHRDGSVERGGGGIMARLGSPAAATATAEGRKQKICRKYNSKKGCGFGSKCWFKHEKLICQEFEKKGTCSNRKQCPRLHPVPTPENKAELPKNGESSSSRFQIKARRSQTISSKDTPELLKGYVDSPSNLEGWFVDIEQYPGGGAWYVKHLRGVKIHAQNEITCWIVNKSGLPGHFDAEAVIARATNLNLRT